MKKCKYCQSEIDQTAIVCPNCRRNLSNANNPLLLIPICGILFFFGWCFFSNDAPFAAKEIFCSFGLRSGNYCYVTKSEYQRATNTYNTCYITYNQFNRIENGMSYNDVKNIIGCDGILNSESNVMGIETKMYYWYNRDSSGDAIITFSDGVVAMKAQYNL